MLHAVWVGCGLVGWMGVDILLQDIVLLEPAPGRAAWDLEYTEDDMCVVACKTRSFWYPLVVFVMCSAFVDCDTACVTRPN